MDYKEKIIQKIKDSGQSYVDSAKNIRTFKKEYNIKWCSVDEINDAPQINVDIDFYPEYLIDRLNTNDKE